MARGKKNMPTVFPTEFDKAYAAGFIDADGCITVRSIVPGGAGRSHYASITASQTKIPPLVWLQERWGGSLRELPPRKGNSSAAWEWAVVGNMAYTMLDDIKDYLKIKGPRAENALALRTIRDGRQRGNPLSDAEFELQRVVKETAMELNKRGRI